MTGKTKSRSTGCVHRRDADRFAAKLEVELAAGETRTRSTWGEATDLFLAEFTPGLDPASAKKFHQTFRLVDRLIEPRNLEALTEGHIASMVAAMRRADRSEWTIKGHLQRLGQFLDWCVRRKVLAKAPNARLETSPVSASRGRAITEAEFSAIIRAVPVVVGKNRSDEWKFLIRGLWLSGLRLGEASRLTWDDSDFCVDLSGEYPRFRIQPRGQKNRRYQFGIMAPEFWEHIQFRQRTGNVFRHLDNGGKTPHVSEASRIISSIGMESGVLTLPGQHPTAHDLRRSFGQRWATKVRAPVLMSMMRHRSINTTMQFYVSSDADVFGQEVWSGTAQPERGDTASPRK